ncbi:Alanine aminotransferase [Operophtera brumata]|uniref:alanine transaminase n=1 Tax=Operophtera brumata TaxID=104452 RepID=A0A0L7LIW0_OPEBR|nr:Alanine aminotransferase [Operophtera brumata]
MPDDDVSLAKFELYMERYWLKSDDFIAKWSSFGQIIRTTNCLEGWHSKIHQLVGRRKSNLVSILNVLKKDSDLYLIKMKGGLLEIRRKEVIRRDEFISNTNTMLINFDMEVGLFLERKAWKGSLLKIGKSVGAYTVSHGIELIRRRVAEFIERRDGHPARWEDVCLSGGASTAIKNCLQLLCNDIGGKTSGVLVPIPQYPLYSASLAEYGLAQVGYYLDEDNNWGLDVKELERAIAAADCNVRALVVINPGNPTGQWLDVKELGRAMCAVDCNVRALVVINAGNPTGQWLDVKELERAIAAADCNVRALVVISPGNPTGQVTTLQLLLVARCVGSGARDVRSRL